MKRKQLKIGERPLVVFVGTPGELLFIGRQVCGKYNAPYYEQGNIPLCWMFMNYAMNAVTLAIQSDIEEGDKILAKDKVVNLLNIAFIEKERQEMIAESVFSGEIQEKLDAISKELVGATEQIYRFADLRTISELEDEELDVMIAAGK